MVRAGLDEGCHLWATVSCAVGTKKLLTVKRIRWISNLGFGCSNDNNLLYGNNTTVNLYAVAGASGVELRECCERWKTVCLS